MTALFWLAYVFFRLRNGSLRGRLVCTVFLPNEIWARLMINFNCKTVNRRLMIYHFGPHHVAEEIRRSSGGFRPRRSWKLHALCFSFAFERASVQSGELTVPKSHETTQKNECKYTSLIWLSLSGFEDEMSRFAVFIKHFSGSLPSCRDRPLHITNNVIVQLANQIAYVTRPQTHRVVYLWPMDSKFLTV